MRSAAPRIVLPLLALAAIFVLWELLSLWLRDPRLPRFTNAASAIAESPGLFVGNALLTVSEAAVGLMLAIALGFLIALALVSSRVVRLTFLPHVIAAQSVPLIAIAPLLAAWFGQGFSGRVVIVTLLCWFPTAINATRGMLSVDPVPLALFKIHRASRLATLVKLRIPNSIAFLHSGIRISSGLAMIGAIISEYGPVGRGLGQMIFAGTIEPMPDYPSLYAAVLFAALGGYTLAEAATASFQAAFARFMGPGRD